MVSKELRQREGSELLDDGHRDLARESYGACVIANVQNLLAQIDMFADAFSNVARRYPYQLRRDEVRPALKMLDHNVMLTRYGFTEERCGFPNGWRRLQEIVSLLAEEPAVLEPGSALSHLLSEIRYGYSPRTLVKAWKRFRPRLERALYEFLYNRDAPEAERARATRDQRRLAAERLLREGRTARLTKAAEQRQRILGYARSMIDDGVARRELASRIARKADVKRTVGHIRKILREGAVL